MGVIGVVEVPKITARVEEKKESRYYWVAAEVTPRARTIWMVPEQPLKRRTLVRLVSNATEKLVPERGTHPKVLLREVAIPAYYIGIESPWEGRKSIKRTWPLRVKIGS